MKPHKQKFLLPLFFFVVLILLIPNKAKALGKITNTKSLYGSTLYTYESTNAPFGQDITSLQQFLTTTNKPTVSYSTISTEKNIYITNENFAKAQTFFKIPANKPTGHYLFSERSIIVPIGTTQADKIYIFFNGIGWNEYKPEITCGPVFGLCTNLAKLKAMGKNAVAIVPRYLNFASTGITFTQEEMRSFLDEALEILRSSPINVTFDESTPIILAGHSGGGNAIKKFVEIGYTAGHPVSAAIFLDASYGSQAQSVAAKINKTFVYYGDLKHDVITPKKNTWTHDDAITTSKNYSTKAKVLYHPPIGVDATVNHRQIAVDCFLDHITGDNCGGTATTSDGHPNLAEEDPNYHPEIVNTFNTIDGTSPSYIPTASTQPLTRASYDEIKNIINQPDVQINIPGLKFTDKETVAKNIYEGTDGTYMSIPYLGEYISAIYKYLIVIAGILAVVMIIKYGFNWTMSGGESEKINGAKKGIGQILVGLLIAVFSYTLLYTINPDFVSLRSLKIKYIPEKYLNAEEHEMMTPETYNLPQVQAQNATYNIQKPSWNYQTFDCNKRSTYQPAGVADPNTLTPFNDSDCPGLIGSGLLIKPMAEALCKAGKIANDRDYQIRVGDSYRPFDVQVNLWCAPERASISPMERKNRVAVPGNSNHGQGRAVDVFLVKKDENQPLFDSTYDKQCKVNNDYIKILAEIMYAADTNIVRLSTEIWHFEYGTSDNTSHKKFLNKPAHCNKKS